MSQRNGAYGRFLSRLQGRYQKSLAGLFFRRPFTIRTTSPLISFTFDDFPRSALHAGGLILNRFGVAATYYVSLGLLGKESPSGQIAVADDLRVLLQQSHELGCHTFSHCDAWESDSAQFEASIIENRIALNKIVPGATFKSFSYPMSPPRPMIKGAAARHFMCSRGGGQTFNVRTVDLNHLSAYFLEKSGERIRQVKDIIDCNQQSGGWLIFATHDIAKNPSRFGCSPEFFEEVVRYSARSGARILPVASALDALGTSRSQSAPK